MNDRLVDLIYQGNEGQRLDKFLVGRLPDLSRARIQRLIKDGFVRVDGQKRTRAGRWWSRAATCR